MSWWIIIYLGLFTTLSAGGFWDDFCNRRPVWFLGCTVASNLTVIYLFVAFWCPSLRIFLGNVAPIIFVASMFWELFQVVEDIHGLQPDPEISKKWRRVIYVFAALALPVICLPAFIIAGISAFKV